MHMMIAHGPSEQLEQSKGPEEGKAVELSERSMNDMRVQQGDKRHLRRHPHRTRRARR